MVLGSQPPFRSVSELLRLDSQEDKMKPKKLLVMVFLGMALVSAGCGNTGTDPDASISGRYDLETVDGNNIP